jgi:hypothetical protein
MQWPTTSWPHQNTEFTEVPVVWVRTSRWEIQEALPKGSFPCRRHEICTVNTTSDPKAQPLASALFNTDSMMVHGCRDRRIDPSACRNICRQQCTSTESRLRPVVEVTRHKGCKCRSKSTLAVLRVSPTCMFSGRTSSSGTYMMNTPPHVVERRPTVLARHCFRQSWW